MVREEQVREPFALGELFESGIARGAGARFETRTGGDVQLGEVAIQPKGAAGPKHEPGIGGGFCTARPVVHMQDLECRPKAPRRSQQRHGIGPAGAGHGRPRGGGKTQSLQRSEEGVQSLGHSGILRDARVPVSVEERRRIRIIATL